MVEFFKAKIWTGAYWLLTLCIILVLVVLTYMLLHNYYKGSDHKKLDNVQLLNIDNILTTFTDPDTVQLKSKDPAVVNKAVLEKRKQRDQVLLNFLKNEYDGQVQVSYLKRMDSLLISLNNKDAKTYLNGKDIIVNNFFWFVGPRTYAEVLFWALIGVLVSLIYYVSNANRLALKVDGDDDTVTGPFDTAELPGQVSKMFYAPVCALVLALGYDLLGDSNTKMTDISIGKGLLLFSFICGFFSGRVMKFLDKLKDLVLPLGSTKDTAPPATDNNATKEKVANITAELQLAPELASTSEGADIVDGGFNAATVTLKPETGDVITLVKPADDQSAGFTAAKVPFGKYNLQATLASKNGDTIINLAGNKDIEVNDANKTFQLELDKTAGAG